MSSLLEQIRRIGGTVELDGAELVIRRVPKDLIEKLKPRKAEVMGVLRKQAVMIAGVSAWDWIPVIDKFRSDVAAKAGPNAIECRRLLGELRGLIELEDFEGAQKEYVQNFDAMRSHYREAVDPTLEGAALMSMLYRVFPNGHVLSAVEMAQRNMVGAERKDDQGE